MPSNDRTKSAYTAYQQQPTAERLSPPYASHQRCCKQAGIGYGQLAGKVDGAEMQMAVFAKVLLVSGGVYTRLVQRKSMPDCATTKPVRARLVHKFIEGQAGVWQAINSPAIRAPSLPDNGVDSLPSMLVRLMVRSIFMKTNSINIMSHTRYWRRGCPLIGVPSMPAEF